MLFPFEGLKRSLIVSLQISYILMKICEENLTIIVAEFFQFSQDYQKDLYKIVAQCQTHLKFRLLQLVRNTSSHFSHGKSFLMGNFFQCFCKLYFKFPPAINAFCWFMFFVFMPLIVPFILEYFVARLVLAFVMRSRRLSTVMI